MTPASPAESPDEFNHLFRQALDHHRAGRLTEAAADYRQMLTLWPGAAEVHGNLGACLMALGQPGEARVELEQALVLRPDLANAHSNLGILLAGQGKSAEAAMRFERALALKPDFADAHSGLAFVLMASGQSERAAAHYEQAIALRPRDAELLHNLGNVLWQRNKLDEAVARFEQAIAIDPRFVRADNSLAKVLRKQHKFDRAVECCRRAIALDPNYAEVYDTLGNVLACQGKFDEAAASFERAIALKPDLAEAHNNLANMLQFKGDLDGAVARYERALLLHPNLAAAQVGLAICSLLSGDFQRGWLGYEARFRLVGAHRLPNLPRWQGEPLNGRRMLLWAEQGLGDWFQFVRYARIFKQRGAHVILAAPAVLGKLLHLGGDWDEVFLQIPGEPIPSCDFFLPLLSAPMALGTEAATIPAEVPYLSADPELIEHWRRELAAIDGIKIGIVWQGARDYAWDSLRSIPLAEFAPLARLPGVRLISLQKGFGSEQVATAGFPLVDYGSQLDEAVGPFMDTAAIIKNLDLVIAPDSATAHLAGALGVPVFLALHAAGDWRWLLNRDDSPWYPTMRLFRQTTPMQWSDVFERIASAVEQRP